MDGRREAHLNAAANGHICCLQTALADRSPSRKKDLLALAAGHSLPCLVWLINGGIEHNPASTAKDAALHDRPDVLRFLLERYGPLSGICRAAASRSLECLKVARELDCPWGTCKRDDFFPYIDPRAEDHERLTWAQANGFCE